MGSRTRTEVPPSSVPCSQQGAWREDTPGRRSPGGLEVRGGAKRIFGGGVSKTVRVDWRHLHQGGGGHQLSKSSSL